jgi:S-DNA-T family DNA segregation ATPase FtsK/SpoIIIE
LTVLFLLLSPLLLVGSAIEARRGSRRDHREALHRHTKELDAIEADMHDAAVIERQRREEEAPATAHLRAMAKSQGYRLWERRPAHPDFLTLRLGAAAMPSRSTVSVADCPRDDRETLLDRFVPLTVLDDTPVTLSLADVAGIGIAGRGAEGLARALVLQAATLHRPADVVVTGLVRAEGWDWLKWFPHARATSRPLPCPPIACSPRAQAELLDSLLTLLEVRRRLARDHYASTALPHLIVVFDGLAAVLRSRVTPLLEHAREVGISFLWLAPNQRDLPAECGATVVTDSNGSGWLGVSDDGSRVEPLHIERVDIHDAEETARHLAPVVDVSSTAEDGSAMPSRAGLGQLLGDAGVLDDPGLAIERWSTSRGLRAPVGLMEGAPLVLDLRADGPHALIAGTTGAGKSELLQTLVASLALTQSPERVTFLLVDYKGGAAFNECVALPHCVGLVTDLDTRLARRALTSLRAELGRRERLLAQAGATDLADMEAKDSRNTPPSLLIIVDEFAALVREIPEFIDGVVDIAQRGRSLGLHLVLATQRPAGVVTDNIRANTNLRVALRVADEHESIDVIGVSDAARLDRRTPGRAVVRVGPRDLFTFQAAYMGACTRGEAEATPVQIDEFRVETLGVDGPPFRPETPTRSNRGPSDLQRVVATVGRAAGRLGSKPPHRPWLDPLSRVVDLADLTPAAPGSVTIGARDRPGEQAQDTAVLDLGRDGTVLVFGCSGAGKTVLLRTVAVSIGSALSEPSWVYALEGSGHGLRSLEALPHVGAVIEASDTERVLRLLRMLVDLIHTRMQRLGSAHASDLAELRTRTSSTDARVVLLVDDYPALRAAYDDLRHDEVLELLNRIVTEGRATGVHVVAAVDRRAGVANDLAAVVTRRLVLRLADADEYALLGLRRDVLGTDPPPGRGVLDGDEVQVAVPGGDGSGPSQERALRDAAARMNGGVHPRPPPVLRLDADVRVGDLRAPARAGVVLGLSGDSLSPLTVDIASRGFCVFGPEQSGRTTAITTLAAGLRAGTPRARLFVLNGRRDPAASLRRWATPIEAGELLALLHGRATADEVVVFIDDLDEHDGELDEPLGELLRVARDHPVRLVVSCANHVARRCYSGPLAELRNGRHGLLLRPDLPDDGDVFSVRLPRVLPLAMPPGRGLLVDRAHIELVQVARP